MGPQHILARGKAAARNRANNHLESADLRKRLSESMERARGTSAP